MDCDRNGYRIRAYSQIKTLKNYIHANYSIQEDCMKDKYTFNLTLKEKMMLDSLIRNGLIDAYQGAKATLGGSNEIDEEWKERLEVMGSLFNNTQDTESDNYIKIYEDVKARIENGEEVTF